MQPPEEVPRLTYRLVFKEDGRGCPRTIEFEARSMVAALEIAEACARGRELELFENGRRVGHLKCTMNEGYWIIPPNPSRRAMPPSRRASAAFVDRGLWRTAGAYGTTAD